MQRRHYLCKEVAIRDGEWSWLKNHESREIFAEFHGSRNSVFFSGYVRFFKAKKVLKKVFVLYIYIPGISLNDVRTSQGCI